jgi:tetratricopeptide (TPR) repeat protein
MSEHLGLARRLWVWGMMAFLLAAPLSARARQVPGADPAAAEEAREQRGMERFLSLLEKNPRRGTALDRVYGYHVERGTLDTFIKSFEERVAKKPDDSTGWLILGLLEGQRGQDAAAVKALEQAETTRPDDPLPAYYLGQALVLVGQPEQAAGAFERALGRKPARNDLLEIFQALGRVYERTQKSDQALQVWNRLEAHESRNRSPPLSPRKTSPQSPCLASRISPNASPTPSARSSSPCRPRT